MNDFYKLKYLLLVVGTSVLFPSCSNKPFFEFDYFNKTIKSNYGNFTSIQVTEYELGDFSKGGEKGEKTNIYYCYNTYLSKLAHNEKDAVHDDVYNSILDTISDDKKNNDAYIDTVIDPILMNYNLDSAWYIIEQKYNLMTVDYPKKIDVINDTNFIFKRLKSSDNTWVPFIFDKKDFYFKTIFRKNHIYMITISNDFMENKGGEKGMFHYRYEQKLRIYINQYDRVFTWSEYGIKTIGRLGKDIRSL